MVITKVKNKNKKHSKKNSKKFAKNRKNKSMTKMRGGSNDNAEPLSRVQQIVKVVKDIQSKGAEIGDRLSSTRPGYGEIMSRIVKPTKPLLGNIDFADLRSLDGQPIPENFKKIFKKQEPTGTSSKQKALDLLKQYHNSKTESSVTPSSPATQMVRVPRSVELEARDAREKLRVSGLQGQVEKRQESISTPSLFGTPSVPQLVPRFSPPMMTPIASASAPKMTSTSSFKQSKQKF